MRNIIKATLLTFLLIAIQFLLDFSNELIIGKVNFNTDYLTHYYGISHIFIYIVSYSLILFLISKFRIDSLRSLKKVKNINYKAVLFILLIVFSKEFIDRPLTDFYILIESSRNSEVAPFINSEFTTFSYYYSVLILILAPIFEEIFFRKILFTSLLKKHSLITSIIVSSLLFSAIHLPSYINLIPTFIFGIISCLIYIKTKNITYSIIFHFIANLKWLLLNFLGEQYFTWIKSINFNLLHWLLVLIGVSLTIFVLKKLKIANTIRYSLKK